MRVQLESKNKLLFVLLLSYIFLGSRAWSLTKEMQMSFYPDFFVYYVSDKEAITGKLKFKTLKYKDLFVIDGVIDVVLLPEGRSPMESFFPMGEEKKTFLVHKRDPDGRTYSHVINVKGETLLELKPTFQSYTRKTSVFQWIEIEDRNEGYFYPLSPGAGGTLENHASRPKNLIGVKSLRNMGPFVKGDVYELAPKESERAKLNENVLEEFGKPQDWPEFASNYWYAYHWKTPKGNRWAISSAYPNLQNIKDTEKEAKYLSIKSFPEHQWDYSVKDEQAGTVNNSKVDSVVFLVEREASKFDLFRGLGVKGDEYIKLKSFDKHDPQAIQLALNEAKSNSINNPLIAARVKESMFGYCYDRIRESALKNRKFSMAYQQAKKCDQKGYLGVIKDILLEDPEFYFWINYDDFDLLATMRDPAVQARLKPARAKHAEMAAEGARSAAAREQKRQRELADRRSTSAAAKNWTPGSGRASNEQNERIIRDTNRRNDENLKKRQLQKSLNRIGNYQ